MDVLLLGDVAGHHHQRGGERDGQAGLAHLAHAPDLDGVVLGVGPPLTSAIASVALRGVRLAGRMQVIPPGEMGGVTWILDGLEVTLVGSLRPALLT